MPKRLSSVVLASMLLISCQVNEESWNETVRESESLASLVETAGAEGVIVLRDVDDGSWIVSDREAAHVRALPASTFKIVNALTSLDLGVTDRDEVFEWDGVDRGGPGWNQDQTLAKALARSSVWVFEIVAQRVGRERMASVLEDLSYGNALTSGSWPYWLKGDLRISAWEQVEFLSRFARGDLPFSKDMIDEVSELILLDHEGEGVLRGKTGWARPDENDVGWFVGLYEREGRTWAFATRVSQKSERFDMRSGRRELIEQALRHEGIIETGAQESSPERP